MQIENSLFIVWWIDKFITTGFVSVWKQFLNISITLHSVVVLEFAILISWAIYLKMLRKDELRSWEL